jgi:hypothetical protein
VGEVEGGLPGGDQAGVEVFDLDCAVENGRGQRHAAAHHQRLGQLQHNHRKAGLVQPVDDARGQVAAAADNDEVFGK